MKGKTHKYMLITKYNTVVCKFHWVSSVVKFLLWSPYPLLDVWVCIQALFLMPVSCWWPGDMGCDIGWVHIWVPVTFFGRSKLSSCLLALVSPRQKISSHWRHLRGRNSRLESVLILSRLTHLTNSLSLISTPFPSIFPSPFPSPSPSLCVYLKILKVKESQRKIWFGVLMLDLTNGRGW